MKTFRLKKAFCLVITLLFALNIFAVTEGEDYIYWYTPSRFDGKNQLGKELKKGETLAHPTLPLGTVVELSVNGETKEITVNDRPLDKRATFGVDATTARELGFYPFLREKVAYRIVRMGKDAENTDALKRNSWYTITPLYPKSGENLITLVSNLIAEGFKTEVDKTGSYAEVKFIPQFSKDSDLEYLKEMVDSSYTLKTVEML